MTILRHLLADEQASAMNEYALMLALIAVATLISITALRDSIIGTFDSTSGAVADDVPEASSVFSSPVA